MIWILIGMPGAGKSTVGALLAATAGCEFVDVDDEIERRESRSIADIFGSDGEDYFRRVERETFSGLIAGARTSSDTVIATGGGLVTTPESRELLRSLGGDEHHTVVWLDAAPETVIARIGSAGRPLLAGADHEEVHHRIRQLSADRRASYMECASVRVACDDSTPAEVASQILDIAPSTFASGGVQHDA